ncbi:DUF4126 domain-containing protein [Pseudonocardia humida]|uniref:DUF4126 domain-containing protein n=1 Tax=Pseudonocardia humida TaxID=2800819 RepID=A0ABT1AAY7_9PSEU|nr:DUF4126 domain-containing protein [Pseudonocardia humida]MCO1660189.1 DUF4126 domain-containing protein [Pseudonocardia humida]
MELLPTVVASGWASGINAYLCVAILGLLGRFGGVEAVPEVLTRTDVLLVAAALYLVEFVADKVPYLDSIWDALSTAVRPTAGVVLGMLLAGDASSVEQAVLAATGGGTALVSHLVKGGLRLVVNTSPEPVTNIGTSLGEDVAVAGVAAMAVLNPVPAAIIAGFLLVIGLLLLIFLWQRVRRGYRRLQDWRARRRAGAPTRPTHL